MTRNYNDVNYSLYSYHPALNQVDSVKKQQVTEKKVNALKKIHEALDLFSGLSFSELEINGRYEDMNFSFSYQKETEFDRIKKEMNL